MMEPAIYTALNGALNGIRVFPCDPKTGKPLIEDVKTAATTDPEEIREMWAKHPSAEVGFIPPIRKKISATPYVWRDPTTIKKREWVYGQHLIRKYATATIAMPGIGKSALVLTEGVALATGRDLLGVKPPKRCRVWYWNGEDPQEETDRRLAAICLHYGIAREEIEGWLFTDSGRDTEIVIARTTRDGATIAEPVAKQLTETITANRIDVVTIDPFVSSHQVTENDNNAIDLVAKRWAKIGDATNAAIELVHHSRKLQGGNHEVTVQDGRGAGALIAAVRSARVLNGMSKGEAEKCGLQNQGLYFRVETGKANLSPPPEGATWFHLRSIHLRNGEPGDALDIGDSVGVVTPWEWPDANAGITGADFDKVAAEVRRKQWRENPQANDWAGLAVATALDIDASNKQGRAKIKSLLAMWRKAGSLRDIDGVDAKSNSRRFTEVSDAIDD